MNGADIIDFILTFLNLKAPTLAKNIGVEYQRIYDIQRGRTKKLSGNVAKAIKSTYPQFMMDWLLTGEGSIFEGEEEHTKASLDFVQKNPEFLKENQSNNTDNALIQDYIDSLKETISFQREEIKRLNSMLESSIQNKKEDAPNVGVADAV
jgi:hypothetical protein